MNLFNLIPGNDPVSKGINAASIGMVLLVTGMWVPAGLAIAGMAVAYCAFTGAKMWTYKA